MKHSATHRGLVTVAACSQAAIALAQPGPVPVAYVADWDNGSIVAVDLLTGDSQVVLKVMDEEHPNPVRDVVVGDDGAFYVGVRLGPRNVQRFGTDGAFMSDVTPQIGINGPPQLAIAPNGDLLVAGQSDNVVYRYQIPSGTLVETYVPDSCCNAFGVAVDGDFVYVSDNSRFERFSLTDPNPEAEIVVELIPNSILTGCRAIEIGHDGNLYACGKDNADRAVVQVFDVPSGTHLGTFADFGPGLEAYGIDYSPELSAYYITTRTDKVYEYDESGALIRTLTSPSLVNARSILVRLVAPLEPCIADIVPDGQLDFSDVLAFLGAFTAQLPQADLAEPFGQWDFSDVVAFLGAFGAGCP